VNAIDTNNRESEVERAQPTESVRILRVDKAAGRWTDDIVVREAPLTLYVNDSELVTLLCTPVEVADLAVGFLFSEGIVSSVADIARVSHSDSKGIVWVTLGDDVPFSKESFQSGRAVTSGCARGQTFAHITDKLDLPSLDTDTRFPAERIYKSLKNLSHLSTVFEQTGGVHVAALFDGETMVVFREDIGRHNAVDKVIGHCVTGGIDCSDKAMVVSGRLSSEMVIKVARLGVPVLISRSAPTSSALRIADETGMTLIGFARGQRMNVYSHPYRVVDNGSEAV
jgi:FdhD protein